MMQIDLIYVRHRLNEPIPPCAPSRIPYHDLTIVFGGELHYTVNGRSVILQSGDVLFLPIGTLRERAASKETADYISFNFCTESAIELPEVISNAVSGEMGLLVSAYDKIRSRAYGEYEQKTIHLLLCLLLILQDRVKARNLSPLTRKIIQYVEDRLGKKITLTDIGNATFFSPVYCDSVFRKEMGRPIMDYVLERRVDEAKSLLVEGELSLVQIGEAVGFSDYNYFSRTFKKRCGYSPSVYRNMIRR